MGFHEGEAGVGTSPAGARIMPMVEARQLKPPVHCCALSQSWPVASNDSERQISHVASILQVYFMTFMECRDDVVIASLSNGVLGFSSRGIRGRCIARRLDLWPGLQSAKFLPFETHSIITCTAIILSPWAFCRPPIYFLPYQSPASLTTEKVSNESFPLALNSVFT